MTIPMFSRDRTGSLRQVATDQMCVFLAHDVSWRKRADLRLPGFIDCLDDPLQPLVPGNARRYRPYEETTMAQLVSRIPQDLLSEFVMAVQHRFAAKNYDIELWGPAPTVEEVEEAAAWRAMTRLAIRAEAAHSGLSLPEVAGHLGLSRAEVMESVEGGRLVATRYDDQWHFPRWQFDSYGAPLLGIPELIRAYRGGAAALSAWVTRPHPELHGSRPADLLQKQDWQKVVELARADSGAGQ